MFIFLLKISDNGYMNQSYSSYQYEKESRVYLPEEIDKMSAQLAKRIEEKPEETDAYAVILLFKVGLRIGEVVALKWSDID